MAYRPWGKTWRGALEPLIEQHITKPIESLNLELGERQANALERMAADFRDTLVSHVGEELHRFGEAIKSARAHQLATLGEIEAFMLLLEEVSKTQLDVLDRGGQRCRHVRPRFVRVDRIGASHRAGWGCGSADHGRGRRCRWRIQAADGGPKGGS